MMERSTQLGELAGKISAATKLLETYLANNNLPAPSFAADGLKSFPSPAKGQADVDPEILKARDELIDATQDLRTLALGPKDTIKSLAIVDFNLTACLQAIYHFRIAQTVPMTGTISLTELAAATKLTVVDVSRIVRLAAVHRIFAEPEPSQIAHTAISALLADETSGMMHIIGHMTEVAFPASARMSEFLASDQGASQEPSESPYALAFGAGSTMFGTFQKDPAVMRRFIGCMTAWAEGDGCEGIVKGWDWGKLKQGAKVVDIGGAAGHISFAVAAAYPDLTITVQDVPPTRPQADALAATYPSDVSSRVAWIVHDFFQPQPPTTQHADVYFLRYICHDWSDKYAAKILKHVADAMAPGPGGSRLLIADAILPPREVQLPRAQEAVLRAFDVSMLCQLNAKERAFEDWVALLKLADSRFEVVGVTPPAKAGEVSIIEIVLGN